MHAADDVQLMPLTADRRRRGEKFQERVLSVGAIQLSVRMITVKECIGGSQTPVVDCTGWQSSFTTAI